MKIRGMFLLLAVLLAFYSFACAQEQLVLTTYYPSPSGSYSELFLAPKAEVGTDCDNAAEAGKMFYNLATNTLRVCKTISGATSWQDASGNWMVNAANTQLYANNTAWNVGIGTTTPAEKLQVGDNAGAATHILIRTGAAGVAGVQMMGGTVGVWHMDYDDNLDMLKIGRGGAEYMYIENGGNVGVNIVNPTEKLEVGGNIKVSGNVLMGYERRDSGWQLTRTLSISCSDPATKKIVGGGCLCDGELVQNYPSSDTQWDCVSRNGSGIQAFVICANIDN